MGVTRLVLLKLDGHAQENLQFVLLFVEIHKFLAQNNVMMGICKIQMVVILLAPLKPDMNA